MKIEYHSTRPVVNIPLPEESELIRKVTLGKISAVSR